jgi:hypothetical protein
MFEQLGLIGCGLMGSSLRWRSSAPTVQTHRRPQQIPFHRERAPDGRDRVGFGTVNGGSGAGIVLLAIPCPPPRQPSDHSAPDPDQVPW